MVENTAFQPKMRKGHQYRINRGGYQNALVSVVGKSHGMVMLEFPGAILYPSGKTLRHEWREDRIEVVEEVS